jgi:hypothetical protein
VAEDNVTPIGERLGSERLYAEDMAVPPPPTTWTRDSMPPGFAISAYDGELDEEPPPPANPPPQPGAERGTTAKLADVNWRNFVGNCLEIAGITAITAGSWLIAAWLGLVVLGVCLILLGVAQDIQRSK